jgi:Sigma-70 region 2
MTDFEELYERYAKDVYRFALYLSGSPAQAEDITSETFVRVFTSRDTIRTATVKAYLCWGTLTSEWVIWIAPDSLTSRRCGSFALPNLQELNFKI